MNKLKVSEEQFSSSCETNYSSRSLIIGLGGMGLKTLYRLKRELKERVGDISDAYLQILNFDTDCSERDVTLDKRILLPEEFPRLMNHNITAHLSAVPEHCPKAISEILPNGFRCHLNGFGSNQNRLAGRLTIMDLSLFQTIYNSISNAITQLQDFTTATLDVHIVAGLGGGSGSGMIIDVPYIVRAILCNLGVTESKLRLFGHLYLPNSYGDISNLDLAFANSYAALKEIDYYMKLEAIGESFEATYPDTTIGHNGHFVSVKNIFDRCILISGNARNMGVKYPNTHALSMCVQNMMSYLICDELSEYKNTQECSFFHTESWVKSHLPFPPIEPSYCFIGWESIYFPVEVITSQLIGEMMVRVEAHMNEKAAFLTEYDVDLFENGLLKPADIIRSQAEKIETLLDDVLNNSSFEWTRKSIAERKIYLLLDFAVISAINTFEEDNTIIQKINNTAFNKAKLIFTDPDRGPYYLEALLKSNRSSSGIHGFYQRIHEYYTLAKELKKFFEMELEQATATIENLEIEIRKFGYLNRNLNTYKEALKQQYIAKFNIKLCEHLIVNYYNEGPQNEGVAFSVKKILDNQFIFVDEILRNLHKELIHELKYAAEQLKDNAVYGAEGISPIIDFVCDAVGRNVQSYISSKLTEFVPEEYIGALTCNIIEKNMFEESECECAISRFIKQYPLVEACAKKTLTDYILEVCANSDSLQPTEIMQSLLSSLLRKSEAETDIYAVENEYIKFFLLQAVQFPQEIKGYVEENGRYIVNKSDHNTLVAFSEYLGLPLWLHKDLKKYEEQYIKYVNLHIQGLHIDENPNKNPSWIEFPSPCAPSSYVTQMEGFK